MWNHKMSMTMHIKWALCTCVLLSNLTSSISLCKTFDCNTYNVLSIWMFKSKKINRKKYHSFTYNSLNFHSLWCSMTVCVLVCYLIAFFLLEWECVCQAELCATAATCWHSTSVKEVNLDDMLRDFLNWRNHCENLLSAAFYLIVAVSACIVLQCYIFEALKLFLYAVVQTNFGTDENVM